MSFLCILLISSEAVRGRRERLLIIIYLVPKTWRTSKLNNRIYASHRVNKAFNKSVPDLLNWAAKTFTSVFKKKWTPYNQNRNFLNTLKIARHSRFVISYLRSAWFHILLSYLKGQRRFFIICIKMVSYLSKLASVITMISPTSSE
jgi:hypothetical protein